jgi:hypothetical protein
VSEKYRCETCLFWREVPPDGDAVNECRRNAPFPGDGSASRWPMTKASDWCGEYKKKGRK